MALSNSVDPALACPCGSGLRFNRCCGLDWAAAWPDPGPAPDIERARAALTAGDPAEAERLMIELLERVAEARRRRSRCCTSFAPSQGRTAAAEALLARIVRLDPNNLAATQALALSLFTRGALAEAEVHARNAVRIAPTDAQSHNLMGMIMTEAQRPQVGEHHYRRAMELIAEPSPILIANLAWNLKNQGRMAESRKLYEESVKLDPAIFQTLYGWAQMEETDRNFARAGELLDAAETLSPGNPSVLLHARDPARAGQGLRRGAGRARRHRDGDATGGGLGPIEWSEKGLLLDRMGRYAEAFAAFSEGKRTLARADRPDLSGGGGGGAGRGGSKAFFVAPRLKILPRAGVRSDVAQPIFVVGFPRSGTTMIEQTLSAHPLISAGDELPIVNELTGLIPRMLKSPLAYPEAFAELWLGDQVEGLDNLARLLSAARPPARRDRRRARRWFTDKMPLNETHLGLIGADLPAGAGHPPPAPSARRGAVGLLQSPDARLLLRLRSDEHRPPLRAGDGPRRALPARDGAANTWPCATRT